MIVSITGGATLVEQSIGGAGGIRSASAGGRVVNASEQPETAKASVLATPASRIRRQSCAKGVILVRTTNERDTRSPANAERQVVSRQGDADAGECRIRMVARGSGTDGEVGKAGVRRVQRELDRALAPVSGSTLAVRDRYDQHVFAANAVHDLVWKSVKEESACALEMHWPHAGRFRDLVEGAPYLELKPCGRERSRAAYQRAASRASSAAASRTSSTAANRDRLQIVQNVVAADGTQLTRVVGSKTATDLDRPRDVAIRVGRSVVKAGDQLTRELRSSIERKTESLLEELVDIHVRTLPERAA
jgi:hypothetical protein